MGASRERVMELASKWGCTDDDAQQFVARTGGELRLFRDGDQWCCVNRDFVNLQDSQAGLGPTCLDAMADYRKGGK